MQLKFNQLVMLITLATASSLASARMLAQPMGVVDVTPTHGRGVINIISTDKGIITIDGMNFLYSSGKVHITGASSSHLKAGQQIEYTAIPEGKMQRVSEVRVISSPD